MFSRAGLKTQEPANLDMCLCAKMSGLQGYVRNQIYHAKSAETENTLLLAMKLFIVICSELTKKQVQHRISQ